MREFNTAAAIVIAAGALTAMSATAMAASTELPAAVNGTITLSDDVELAATAALAEDTVLDLNGHTISKTDGTALAVTAGANVTIKDSSADQTGTISASGKEYPTAVVVGKGGCTLNFESGSIKVSGQESAGIYASSSDAAATVNVKGGSITADGIGTNAIFVGSSATTSTVNYYDGNISVTGQSAIGIMLQGIKQVANISGGTISANANRGRDISTAYFGSPASRAHEINISGGYLKADGSNGICLDLEENNDVNITGGKLESISSNGIVSYSGNVISISGGEIIAKATAVMPAVRNTDKLTISNDAVVKGGTAAIGFAAGTGRTTTDPALVTITGGYINGKLTERSAPYTIYDINGGYFTDEITNSAYYNYDLAKGKSADDYAAVSDQETYELKEEQNTDKNGDVYNYVIAEKSTETVSPAEKLDIETSDGSMAFWSEAAVQGTVDLTGAVWRVTNNDNKSVDIAAAVDGLTVTNGTIVVGLVLTANAIADNEIESAAFIY